MREREPTSPRPGEVAASPDTGREARTGAVRLTVIGDGTSPGGSRMFPVNHDDPRSTAAAALSLVEVLAATCARLAMLVTLVERTRALLAAERAIGRRR